MNLFLAIVKYFCIVIICIYLIVCVLLYMYQEKIIFPATKLSSDYHFQIDQSFEEINITATDGVKLHGLHFKVDQPKGLIYYLHGNGGCLDTWFQVANTYTSLGYDLFMLDYRSYGKSGGEINNENQLHSDVQVCYDMLKVKCTEDKIIVLGYSMGTGFASRLAAHNNPSKLILLAPYYNLSYIRSQRFAIIPDFLLRYKLNTAFYLPKVKAPIVIFHGDQDEAIPYDCALRLQKLFKRERGDILITLMNQTHNGIDWNLQYVNKINDLLGNK